MAGTGDAAAAVRDGQGLNRRRLADYLKGRLAGADRPMVVRQFLGGAANLTYELIFGDRRYVLRRPPLGPVARSSHDMGREYRVLSALNPVLPMAPRAFLFCDDPGIIGASFVVIERRYGTIVRRHMPAELCRPGIGAALSVAAVDALATLHGLDHRALGLADLGPADGFLSRQVRRWHQRWLAAGKPAAADMASVGSWLQANIPRQTRTTLVHNDYKLDNLIFAPNDPGKVSAILDWEMCTLGDPLVDLGTLLTYWIDPGDSPALKAIAAMPSGDYGFLTRRELVRRYAQRSGIPIPDMRFYHALGWYRLTVMVTQLFQHRRRGPIDDPRLRRLPEMQALFAAQALAVIEGD